MKKQLKIFHLLQLAHAALFKAADRKLKSEMQISTTQLGVLFSLAKCDNAPITAIADQLNMSYSSMSGVVDRMSKAELVKREKNPNDARVQNVILLPKGKALCEQSSHQVRNINRALLSEFSIGEQETIARFLVHVAKNAEKIVASDNSPPSKKEI
ncbi:MarR family winged helix-turn-helix transcriptional regulator [Paraglaciecola polaris]|uniref:MarR family transcriptional regulator n=1 Tax=Paraglaciecola polaris LMG 21857 TaxID=1129793 RepID=K6ZW71_9ALTE|nr:MarR family winged helix-turn-helix transcriptional regulator [Paraglaciecola polaris]GAC33033.1 MarR family transcriptional regulator [Paraglaciecola polaris LMG 21857]|tara:strand:+ start:5780 stop:6247 length:468 start_codon:yes stop_codon:yes gene_type:complete